MQEEYKNNASPVFIQAIHFKSEQFIKKSFWILLELL